MNYLFHNMTSFGWKRKANSNLAQTTSVKSIFGATEDNDRAVSVPKWLGISKKKKLELDENVKTKSDILKKEGIQFAENGKFDDALKLWDQALLLTPSDIKLLDMKAQVLLQVDQSFLAVQVAIKAIMVEPTWWVSYQTLGRAQLGLGEVKMAIISFSKAVHISPNIRELWEDDLKWAIHLLKEQKQREKELEEANLSQDNENNKCNTDELTDTKSLTCE